MLIPSSKVPATAGKVITEHQLRAYLKCSEFYSFGGVYETPVKLRIVERTVEKLISSILRQTHRDRTLIFTKALLEATRAFKLNETMLEPQVEKLIRECTILTDAVFAKIPMKKYFPVTGPLPFRVKVSKTPIDMKVSGVLRTTKDLRIHIVTFLPYSNPHAVRWDVGTHLKLLHFKQAGIRDTRGHLNKINMHCFGISEESNELTYALLQDEDLDQNLIHRAQQLVLNMEQGYKMPLVPCMYACPYKKKCQP
jgi:hypothetical protein